MEPEKPIVSNISKSTESTTKTGWIKEGDKWTYRYSSGEKCYGWLKDGGNWYYFDRSGMVQNERLKIDGKYYYFDSDGHISENINTVQDASKTGWIEDKGEGQESSWRYVYSNGQNCTGWLQDNGYWYYFDKCGHMVENQMRKINGKIYSFDPKGRMEVNTSRETVYHENYFNHTGPTDGSGLLCASTWLKIECDSNGVCTLTSKYYSDINIMLCRQTTHTVAYGTIKHTELFDKNGDQVFGWYLEPIYTWNADSKDFSTVERWTYYDENGLEVIGTSKVIDGKTYSFDSNGYLI